MGVAYWVLPRFRTGSERGGAVLPWAAYWLLNVGALLVVAGKTLSGPASAAPAGRVFEGLAAGAFVAHALPRIKRFGSGT